MLLFFFYGEGFSILHFLVHLHQALFIGDSVGFRVETRCFPPPFVEQFVLIHVIEIGFNTNFTETAIHNSGNSTSDSSTLRTPPARSYLREAKRTDAEIFPSLRVIESQSHYY